MEKLKLENKYTVFKPEEGTLPRTLEDLPQYMKKLVIWIEGLYSDIASRINWLLTKSKAVYAELSDSTDQAFAVPGTAYSITFGTNDEIVGITHSISSSTENIIIVTTGVYTIFAQPQVTAAAGGAGTFHMWLQKDSGDGFADIANTNIELLLASLDEDVIPLATTFLLNAGDIIRLRASVSDAKIKLDAQAPAGEPAIPSIIFTMFMIGT